MDKVGPGGSFGKWPVAVALAGVVEEGALDWDTRANEVFSWWTTDKKDKRWGVTLRHLLTQTSGFSKSGTAAYHKLKLPCMNPAKAASFSLQACARQIYENCMQLSAPGHEFEANKFHIQIAVAMAAQKKGMDALELFENYLYKTVGMSMTHFVGRRNPCTAGGIQSNGVDMDKFLHGYMTYSFLHQSTIRELDTEYVQRRGVKVRTQGFPAYTPYAMGHYSSRAYEAGCSKNITLDVDVQSARGSTGWRGYIDRDTGVYIAALVDNANENQIGQANPIQDVLALVYDAMGQFMPGKLS